MGKFFSVTKNQVAVLSTLLVLIILGVSYFFIYIPGNEKTVDERRFRCLQKIDLNIHSKIESNISMLNNLLYYPKNRDSTKAQKTLETFIAHYPSNFGALLVINTIKSKSKETKSLDAKTDSIVTINTDLNSGQFTIHVARIVKKHKTIDSITIGIRYKFDQFVKPLLPPDVFDKYIVFVDTNTKHDHSEYEKTKRDKTNSGIIVYNSENENTKGDKTNSGTIVYETFQSGLSYKTKDSLLTTKNGITGPGVRGMTIAGTDYKVFSQPITVGGDNWIIVGLVSGKNYQNEKSQLPTWIVLMLLTTAFGMIISLPWVKLYHMGNKDKLTVSDGVASVLVSMLLMSLLFFAIFKYGFHLSSDYKRFSSSADTLAAKMTKSFTTELHAAHHRVYVLDSLYNERQKDIKKLGDTTSTNKDTKDPKTDAMIKKSLTDFSIDQVYWIDSIGKELNNWSTGNDYVPHSDLSSRDYFKKIINDKPYLFGNNKFYIDQVISLSNGTFTSVISIPSHSGNAKVAAMSFTMKSLDSVIMPDGYEFAIIDTSGEVRYHSHPERNLNENLEMEFADSSKLVSCIEARSDLSFDAEYYGRQYRIKIKPIGNLPYFTVIFENKEYEDTRDIEAYAFTLSMLILLFIFLVFQFCVVFFVSSKRSFLKKQFFDTSWVGPKISSHRQYNIAIMGNGIIIVLLLIILILNFCSFLEYLYILLFSITSISIFLNIIFAKSYRKCNPENRKFKIIAIIWLCVFILVIDISAAFTLELLHELELLVFELILTVIGIVIYTKREKILGKAKEHKERFKERFFDLPWTYTHSFALMATMRLIITSGIPVAFFFIYSFNYEQNLDMRYRQLKFARALVQKIRPENIPDKLEQIKKGSLFNAGVYNDSIFVKNVDPVTFVQGKELNKIDANFKFEKDDTIYTREDSLNVKILSAFRFLNNSIEYRSDNVNFPKVDEEAFFNSLLKEHVVREYNVETYYKIGPHEFIGINSDNTNYPLSLTFIGQLILLLPIFYYMIHNIIRKLFALNLPMKDVIEIKDGWEPMDTQLLLDNKLNKLVFMLGSPGSGKLRYLKEKLKGNKLSFQQEQDLSILDDEERNKKFGDLGKLLGIDGKLLIYSDDNRSRNTVFIADMILISAQTGEDDPDWKRCKKEALSGYSLVIINHFEYNIKDIAANSIKLDFLESLMQKEISKIVIISTVHPLTFLDSFNQQQSSQIPESELERWEVLLGHFRIIIKPLEGNLEKFEDKTPLTKTIIDETRYSHYLNNMRSEALKSLPTEDNGIKTGLIGDSVIFKLQITSHYFYTYIWQSLTKEEKFLLYDLAEEGLVNSYDDYNLSILLYKGLIIRPNGTLMLFNKGFRNFILTAIGNTEVNRIKAQVKDNGNWGSLKTPLNLAIIAILGFLIVSRQEAYTQIITYITALGAGIPVVLRLFSMVGNNNTQKTS